MCGDEAEAVTLCTCRQATSTGIAEMFAEAHANAPRSGGAQLAWMTIAQAATTLRISKSVLSTWATRGYIASVKGDGANDHRYLHLDNVLHFLADRMTAHEQTAADPDLSVDTTTDRDSIRV